MRAAMLFKPGDIRVIEMDKPSPGTGEALIEVQEVGVCASDIHWYEDGRIGDTIMTEPLILGHEFAGVVKEVGSNVTNVKIGDRVAVEPAIPCYKCDMCAAGEYNICRNIRFCGTPPTNGAFREFINWPAHLLEPVPDSVSMGEAAMLEPLAVGLYAVEIAGDISNRSVGVLGTGAIGLSILQAARIAGCGEIIATDLYPNRLDLARKLGANHTFEAGTQEVVNLVLNSTNGYGLDVVFEAAGQNDAVVQATEMVKPGGLVLIAGIPDDDRIVLSAGVVRRKGLTIKLVRRSKGTLRRAIQLLQSGSVNVASYITHRFPLDHVKQAIETARDRKNESLRVVVQANVG